MRLFGLHRKKARTQIIIKTDANRLTNNQVEGLKPIANRSGYMIVSTPDYEQLERDVARTGDLDKDVRDLRKRPTQEAYDALNERMLQALEETTSLEQKKERLERQVANQEGRIRKIEDELAHTQNDLKTLAGFAGDAIQAYLGLHRLAHETPPLASTVAICSTDVNGVIASAQLMRTGITVGYCDPKDLHDLLSHLKIRETRNTYPRARGRRVKDIMVKEVVIVGLYIHEQEMNGVMSELNSLYINGMGIRLVTERRDIHLPEFVTLYDGKSLAEAVSNYLHTTNNGEINDRLWALAQREEGHYLAEALRNPLTNTRFVRAVADQLSRSESLDGTPIYNGVRRKADQSSALRKYGVRI